MPLCGAGRCRHRETAFLLWLPTAGSCPIFRSTWSCEGLSCGQIAASIRATPTYHGTQAPRQRFWGPCWSPDQPQSHM